MTIKEIAQKYLWDEERVYKYLYLDKNDQYGMKKGEPALYGAYTYYNRKKGQVPTFIVAFKFGVTEKALIEEILKDNERYIVSPPRKPSKLKHSEHELKIDGLCHPSDQTLSTYAMIRDMHRYQPSNFHVF